MNVIVESTPRLLLNQREAADALGICDRKLWSLSSPRGPIATVRIGKAVRYSVAALEAFVRERETSIEA